MNAKHTQPTAEVLHGFVIGVLGIGLLLAGARTEGAPGMAAAASRPTVGASQPVKAYIALRVVGSTLKTPGGETLGRIETVLVNTSSGQVDFALLAPSRPRGDLMTPIPAQLLTYTWDQAQVGGVSGASQVFTLNVDRSTLAKAPKISRTKITGMRQDWQRQCLAYFEVGELEMGEAPPAPEMVPGAGGYGGPAEASPPVANVASVSVSSSYAPVVLGTNGLPAVSPLSLGTAHPAGTTATGSPGSTTPGRSDPSGVSGQTYPKVTLRPTTRGAFGIPYQTGTPGSVPSPARFGPFGGQAPEGPIRLQPAPARFGAFTTPVPQGVTGLKHARAKFGRFGTWTPTGPMFGAPFEPALPSISPPPTLPPPGTVGPSTSISPPPSILAPPLTPQGRIALPPRIPPPP